MSNRAIKANPSANVRIKSVALPVEHGGWAFLIEPLLLGMLLAPSLAGLFLCIGAFGVFLLYQPLQIALKDYRRHKRYPRTAWAERFVMIYSAVAAFGGLGILLTGRSSFWAVLLAMGAAVPFACAQMLLVIRGRARDAITEICGAIALGATLPTLVMMKGWSPFIAFALWLVPVMRAAPSILYVRTRLRLARGGDAHRILTLAVHGLALLLMMVMIHAALLPSGAIIAMLVLFARAIYGLYAAGNNTPTRVIGFQEIAFGLATILLVAVSYRI